MSEYDVCECDDYRSSHVQNVGPCRICVWSRASYATCIRFRLAYNREPLPPTDHAAGSE